MKKITTFLITVLIFNCSFGQEIEWQKTIGGNKNDYLYSISLTSDGGYILGGASNSDSSGDKTENSKGTVDFWIVKTDGGGNIQWQKTIGGNDYDDLLSIKQTMDGGYILGGSSRSDSSGDKTENCLFYAGGSDYWILKVDSLGNIQWQNTIGGTLNDHIDDIELTSDGGYILGGQSNSNISFDKTENCYGVSGDYWIVKVDSVGNVQWDKTLGGDTTENFGTMKQTSDGGYILVGFSLSNISGNKTENCIGSSDIWIVKLDAVGTIEWQNTIGGAYGDNCVALEQTPDGGYILGASSASNISGDKSENCEGLSDCWMIKIDSLGNIQWQKTIGGSDWDFVNTIHQTANGGYIIGATSRSNISGDKTENGNGLMDIWIIKTDSLGNLVWQNSIGGSNDDIVLNNCLQQTPDGAYIIGGHSSSDISGDKTENSKGYLDYWLVKLTGKSNVITGKSFVDFNSNSVLDSTDFPLQAKLITESNTNRISFTNQYGLYWLTVPDTGSYSVSPSLLNHYNAVPAVHTAHFNNSNEIDSLNDFAFQPIPGVNDLQVSVTPLTRFRSGRYGSYLLHYKNVGTTTLTASVVFYNDSNSTYSSASVPPATITSDSVVWNNITLTPFQEGSITVTVYVVGGVPAGTPFVSNCVINPVSGDSVPQDNYAFWRDSIRASLDPNDKLVSVGTLTNAQLSNSPYLDYIIRFQNTGNDTAFNIKIKDLIDTAKSDITTFELVTSSHPVNVEYKSWEKNLEFDFDNILLPDSNINEPASHGFIHYRIKPITTLAVGDSIKNIALIYFDFNQPVPTNYAVTTIVSCSATLASISYSAANFCFSDTIDATAILNYPSSVSWYVDSVFVSNNLAISIPNLSIGAHQVKLTATNSYCSKTIISNFAVNALPVINLGTDLFTCNIPVTLNAGWGFTAYQWSNGSTTQTIIADTSSLYIATITGLYGCKNADSINVVLFPLPVKPVITQTLAVLTSSALTGNQWFMNGSIITGATDSSYTVTLDGWYYVEVTDSNGCTNASDSIYMMVSSIAETQKNSNGLKLYPNPVHDLLNVSLNKLLPANSKITISDMQGRMVGEKNTNHTDRGNSLVIPIDVSALSQGVYLLRMDGVVRRFVKM